MYVAWINIKRELSHIKINEELSMKIELDSSLMKKIGIDENEVKELIAIALYKYKGIHGSMAGKLIGISEFDFHSLLSEKGESVNYDVEDLIDDIKNNDL